MPSVYDQSNHLGNCTQQSGKCPISDGDAYYDGSPEYVLSRVDDVDMNTTDKTTLFTVPTGRTAVITKIITRNVSTSLTTAVFGFGFNNDANDVVTAALHTALTAAGLLVLDVPKAGAVVGASTNVFGCKCSIAQGAPATATIEVVGYLL